MIALRKALRAPEGEKALARLCHVLVSLVLACSHNTPQVVQNDELPFLSARPASFLTLSYQNRNKNFNAALKRFEFKAPHFRAALPVWYWEAADARALVVIVPGFGSNPESATVQAPAEDLWRQGYSVLSLPSVTHPLFARSASRYGRPGFLPEDQRDLEDALKRALQQLIQTQSKPGSPWTLPDKKILLGLSYGALQTLYWSRQYSQKTSLFDLYIALSPPLDLEYAAQSLDREFDAGVPQYLTPTGQLTPDLTRRIRDVETGKMALTEILNAFEDDELSFLMAWDFRRSLAGILSPREAAHPSHLSFQNYLKNQLIPQLPQSLSLEQRYALWRQSERDLLMRLMEAPTDIEAWAPTLVVHSVDDFLTPASKIHALQASLGRQMLSYRYGGHLGYLLTERFRQDLHGVLKTLP